jgi:hypothetical protein
MKYLLLICADGIEDPEADAAITREIPGWLEEMQRRGIRLQGHELQPPSDATTVRVRAGNVVLTDGPFAETKEYIGGFDIIECADLDEAIEVAAKHPVARFCSVEVRPFAPAEFT